jgi:CubicO group peptidase (beta-lactamase class C family)
MPFTAMAIMQLQEEGKLDVQVTICQYIPDCPDYWQGITIHHLLTHTSGVSDAIRPWSIEADKPTSGLERVELIKQNAPYYQPGEKLRYSENGYVILGAIIEEVSGQTYEGYLDTHIFEPLGMENSGYEGENLAAGYSPTGTKVPDPDVLFRYSAGGLYSTVEDLYLWDQALYGEGLISSHNLDTMFTGYALTPSMDFKGAEYGYGWFIGETLNRRVIFHGGAMSGYTSGILRFPGERVTIIVLRNYGIQIYDRLEIELAKIVFGEG